MAKIKLVEVGWTMLPEGPTTLKITETDYKEDFGKLEVHMVTQEGQKHIERYSFLRNNGQLNEGAQRAFSFFAKTALNNFNLEAIDPEDLVGCYITADVEHEVSDTINENTGKPYVNVRLNNLAAATGFRKVGDVELPEEEELDLGIIDEDDSGDDLDDWLNDEAPF